MRQDGKRLRRRLLVMTLGIQPKDLRGALDLAPVQVTDVLNAERHLQPPELKAMQKLVSEKVEGLFSQNKRNGK